MAELIGALVFLALGVAGAVGSWALGLGTAAEPGAGFLPFWASVMMAASAGAIALQRLRSPRTSWGDASGSPAAEPLAAPLPEPLAEPLPAPLPVQSPAGEPPTATAEEPPGGGPYAGVLRAAGCIVALTVYAMLLPAVGFLAASFVVMFALSRLDAATTWRESFAIAGIGSLIFWFVFVELLGVTFPSAWLGV